MYIGGKYNFGNFTVKMTLALHGSSIGSYPIVYLDNPAALSYLWGENYLLCWGYRPLRDMEMIGRLHKPDLAILPIGDNYTMGPEDALEAIRLIKPKMVIPMHYNTWDLIAQDPVNFRTTVESETNIPVTVLGSGDTFKLT